jgi:HEPN domain-containing protein
MNAPDHALIKKVHLWLSCGEDDLRMANIGFALGDNAPFHLIAYHAHQAVEKNLKAYLVFYRVDFPYTHDLLRLFSLCPEKDPWAEKIHDLHKLMSYAVSTRYPRIHDDITEQEARRAIQIAFDAIAVIRDALISRGVELNSPCE